MAGEATIHGMICGIVTLTHMDGALLGVVLDMVDGIIPGILLGVLVDGIHLTIIVAGTILGSTMDIMVVDIMVAYTMAVVDTTAVDMVTDTVTDITQDLAEADLVEARLDIEIQIVADPALMAQVEDRQCHHHQEAVLAEQLKVAVPRAHTAEAQELQEVLQQ